VILQSQPCIGSIVMPVSASALPSSIYPPSIRMVMPLRIVSFTFSTVYIFAGASF